MFLALLAVAASISLPQGGIHILSIEELGIGSPVSSAVFDGKTVPIFEHGGKIYLLIAADTQKPVGNYPLRVTGDQGGADLSIRIQKGIFRTIRVRTAYKPLTLSPEVRVAKEAERKPMLQALGRGETGRIWQNPFSPPLFLARVSSDFGLRRAYPNHISTHRGVDLVPKNSRVVSAISDARVLWAEDKELYLEGKTVVLDHGQGILSFYLHLSETRVKTGDLVAQGQTIGIVGSTGNSTGVHLHLAIRIGGAHVDPLKFIDAFQNLK